MRTRRSQSSSGPMPLMQHRSVLCHETVESLEIRHDDIVVDCTIGGGGHARAIGEHLWREGVLIGFDLDIDALERVRHILESSSSLGGSRAPRVELINANFRDITNALKKIGVPRITKALFDLGWSSYQLDSGRGFSFLKDEPLLMTYEKHPSQDAVTAEKIVNDWKEESIADVIFGFGEERYARRIAKAIIEARGKRRIQTSLELADIVKAAVPKGYRYGRIHPATKTFQALRIAVNDEFGALTEGLRGAWDLLADGGRIAVISFHSIEDRIVKQQFAAWEKSGAGIRITKKPITPNLEELQQNPRARSAKLRVIEKTFSLYGSAASENKQIPPLDLPGEA